MSKTTACINPLNSKQNKRFTFLKVIETSIH